MPKAGTTCDRCHECESNINGVFCSLSDSNLSYVSESKVVNTYKKGQNLFFQGNPNYGIFCVQEGKIKVSKIGNDGKESIVRIASKGDIIGHRSLFNDDFYTSTATALEKSKVCFIDKNVILSTMEKDPHLSMNIISKLCNDLGVAEKKVASVFQKNVRERLAELLLTLKNNFGVQEGSEWRLEIKLTREEMASMIGVANETLIRFMTEFKEENLIRQEKKTIFIIDEKNLKSFANIQ